jgi:hypothetical protein
MTPSLCLNHKGLGGPFKPSFGVKCHNILYSLSPDILYSFSYEPAAAVGGKVGNAVRFPRRQSRRLFLPLPELTNPTLHQNRLVGVEVEFADHRIAVVDQDPLFQGDDLYPLPAECAAAVPLLAIYLELAVRIHLT